jgi:HD-GYP domain-containing protein (c-di-GMP phosphodiesterase class II)
MSSPDAAAAHAAPAQAANPGDLLSRLDLLQQENEALGRELLRCYEQLNLVFEITENIAKLQDPEIIQHDLLNRFARMINAGALFLDTPAECTQLFAAESAGRPVELPADQLRTELGEQLASVRQTQRAVVPQLSTATVAALRQAHVLLVPLQTHANEAAVVIVVRDPQEPPFDSGDMLASESVLSYGGQVLSNVLMVRVLQQSAVELVRALANAIDAKDNYTCGHSERVGWLARLTGEALGLPENELELLEWAGVLHDVGKIGIPETILNKPGKLTDDEFEAMKRHPQLSYEVLKPVQRLGPVLDGVLYHHENWDGSGYPHKLAGEAIPLTARIIRVVDTFDALTSTRSYRKGFDIDRAYKILRESAGNGTEPRVAFAFMDTFRRYIAERPEDFTERFPHIAEQVRQPDGSLRLPGGPDEETAVPDEGAGA